MDIILFGHKISINITIENMDAERRVIKAIEKELNGKSHKDILNHYKIGAIKVVRRAEISAILINAGLVPFEDVRYNEDYTLSYVGLVYAKNWIETHL